MTNSVVENVSHRVAYTVTDAEDTFILPFTFYDVNDLYVYDHSISETIALSSALFTVVLPDTEYGYQGGSIVLHTPVSNSIIELVVDPEIKRLTNFVTAGALNIPELNLQMNYLTSLVKVLRERQDYISGDLTTVLDAYRAETLIYKNDAETAASNAETSETNAAQSAVNAAAEVQAALDAKITVSAFPPPDGVGNVGDLWFTLTQ